MVCLKPPVWRRLRVTPKPEEPDDSLQADHANPTRRLIRLRTAELSLGPHDTTCPATDARHNGSILPTIGRVFNQKVPSNRGWCRFVGLVVDSITTNHATRPSSRRRSMMLMPNSVLIRLSRYQTM